MGKRKRDRVSSVALSPINYIQVEKEYKNRKAFLMDIGMQEISTPIEQGTLSARIVWDNEAECDGIEVILMRPNGDEEMLFRTTSAEYGISCLVSLPIDDLDWGIYPKIKVDDTRCILDLESSEE